MMLINKPLILTFLFFCLIISCQAERLEYKPMFVCSNKMDNPYGIVAHISRKGTDYEFDSINKALDMIKSVGISNIRVDFDWYTFRNGYTKDSVSFERFDKMMSAVSEKKINVLGIISNTNRDQASIWYNHTDLLVRHYKKRVNYWEIVNEADLFAKRNQNYKPEDYISILKDGYRIVKSYDNNIKVLFTSICDIEYNFMDETFANDASSFFDIMNLHAYTDQKEPEILIGFYGLVKNKIKKYGIEKPIWLTETGYPTKGDNSVSMETQAQRLPRIFLISFALGLDKVFWYNSKASETFEEDRECHFGIFHKDYTPKPAYYAYKTLIQMCPDKSTRPSLFYDEGVYLAKWKRKDKKNVVALWTSEGKKDIIVKSNKKNEIFDINGKPVFRRGGGMVNVSQSIIYVVGEKDIIVF